MLARDEPELAPWCAERWLGALAPTDVAGRPRRARAARAPHGTRWPSRSSRRRGAAPTARSDCDSRAAGSARRSSARTSRCESRSTHSSSSAPATCLRTRSRRCTPPPTSSASSPAHRLTSTGRRPSSSPTRHSRSKPTRRSSSATGSGSRHRCSRSGARSRPPLMVRGACSCGPSTSISRSSSAMPRATGPTPTASHPATRPTRSHTHTSHRGPGPTAVSGTRERSPASGSTRSRAPRISAGRPGVLRQGPRDPADLTGSARGPVLGRPARRFAPRHGVATKRAMKRPREPVRSRNVGTAGELKIAHYLLAVEGLAMVRGFLTDPGGLDARAEEVTMIVEGIGTPPLSTLDLGRSV